MFKQTDKLIVIYRLYRGFIIIFHYIGGGKYFNYTRLVIGGDTFG